MLFNEFDVKINFFFFLVIFFIKLLKFGKLFLVFGLIWFYKILILLSIWLYKWLSILDELIFEIKKLL